MQNNYPQYPPVQDPFSAGYNTPAPQNAQYFPGNIPPSNEQYAAQQYGAYPEQGQPNQPQQQYGAQQPFGTHGAPEQVGFPTNYTTPFDPSGYVSPFAGQNSAYAQQNYGGEAQTEHNPVYGYEQGGYGAQQPMPRSGNAAGAHFSQTGYQQPSADPYSPYAAQYPSTEDRSYRQAPQPFAQQGYSENQQPLAPQSFSSAAAQQPYAPYTFGGGAADPMYPTAGVPQGDANAFTQQQYAQPSAHQFAQTNAPQMPQGDPNAFAQQHYAQPSAHQFAQTNAPQMPQGDPNAFAQQHYAQPSAHQFAQTNAPQAPQADPGAFAQQQYAQPSAHQFAQTNAPQMPQADRGAFAQQQYAQPSAPQFAQTNAPQMPQADPGAFAQQQYAQPSAQQFAQTNAPQMPQDDHGAFAQQQYAQPKAQQFAQTNAPQAPQDDHGAFAQQPQSAADTQRVSPETIFDMLETMGKSSAPQSTDTTKSVEQLLEEASALHRSAQIFTVGEDKTTRPAEHPYDSTDGAVEESYAPAAANEAPPAAAENVDVAKRYETEATEKLTSEGFTAEFDKIAFEQPEHAEASADTENHMAHTAELNIDNAEQSAAFAAATTEASPIAETDSFAALSSRISAVPKNEPASTLAAEIAAMQNAAGLTAAESINQAIEAQPTAAATAEQPADETAQATAAESINQTIEAQPTAAATAEQSADETAQATAAESINQTIEAQPTAAATAEQPAEEAEHPTAAESINQTIEAQPTAAAADEQPADEAEHPTAAESINQTIEAQPTAATAAEQPAEKAAQLTAAESINQTIEAQPTAAAADEQPAEKAAQPTAQQGIPDSLQSSSEKQAAFAELFNTQVPVKELISQAAAALARAPAAPEPPKPSPLFAYCPTAESGTTAVRAEELSSAMCHIAKSGDVSRMMDKLSFSVPKGAMCTVCAPRQYDGFALLQTLGGGAEFTAGSFSIGAEKVNPREQVEMPNLFYADSLDLFDSEITVEQFISFSVAHFADAETAQSLMAETGVSAISDVKLSLLTTLQKCLLYILCACSSSFIDTIIINIPDIARSERDDKMTKGVLEYAYRGGKTILTSVCDMSFAAAYASYIVVINNGKAVFSGGVRDFCAQHSPHILKVNTPNAALLSQKLSAAFAQLEFARDQDMLKIDNPARGPVQTSKLIGTLSAYGIKEDDITPAALSFGSAWKEALGNGR